MANATIMKSAGTTTDSAPVKAKRDRMLNDGSVFLYDLARAYCIDLTLTPVNDAVVKNLVTAGPDALLKVPVAGDLIAVANKGIQLKATTNKGRIQIDPGTNYFQTNLTNDYLLYCWATFPASDPGSHIGMLFSKGADSAIYGVVGPWLAYRYNGSASLPDFQGKFDAQTTSTGGNGYGVNSGNTNPDPASPAGKHQFAIAKVGSNVMLFLDGVQIGATGAQGATPLAANSNPMDFGNKAATENAPRGMIMHRIGCENLTVSGRTAAAAVAADYAQNSSRFA